MLKILFIFNKLIELTSMNNQNVQIYQGQYAGVYELIK
jgi:hypothetical protein